MICFSKVTDIAKAVKVMQKCTTKDPNRPALEFLLVDCLPDGNVNLVTTDGMRMAKFKMCEAEVCHFNLKPGLYEIALAKSKEGVVEVGDVLLYEVNKKGLVFPNYTVFHWSYEFDETKMQIIGLGGYDFGREYEISLCTYNVYKEVFVRQDYIRDLKLLKGEWQVKVIPNQQAEFYNGRLEVAFCNINVRQTPKTWSCGKSVR